MNELLEQMLSLAAEALRDEFSIGGQDVALETVGKPEPVEHAAVCIGAETIRPIAVDGQAKIGDVTLVPADDFPSADPEAFVQTLIHGVVEAAVARAVTETLEGLGVPERMAAVGARIEHDQLTAALDAFNQSEHLGRAEAMRKALEAAR